MTTGWNVLLAAKGMCYRVSRMQLIIALNIDVFKTIDTVQVGKTIRIPVNV